MARSARSAFRSARCWTRSRPLYNTSGCFQRFEGKWDYSPDILNRWSESESPGGATIYFSRAHGTHCVGWGNGSLYERMGGTGSWLGFPKSDEVKRRLPAKDRPGFTVQEFEHGVIIYSAEHGSVAVPRATMECLDQLGGLKELLGLPLRRSPTATADEAVQFFENGVVVIRDESPEVYLRAVSPAEEAPQPIRLVALRFAPEVVTRGHRLLSSMNIRCARVAVPGCARRQPGCRQQGRLLRQSWRPQVDVTPGRHSYNRHLRVPAAAPAGTYRLIGAIWHPTSGEQRLTSLDRGYVVTVAEATE